MVKQTVKRRKLTLKAAALTAGAVVIIAGSAAVVQRTVPKGEKDLIQAHAEAHGESTNGFINRAISETVERDNEKR